MDSLDVVLEKLGFRLMHSKSDQDGKTIHLVRTADGAGVAMLDGDIADLVAGRTTVYDITQLDRANRMGTPWPTLTRPWPRPETDKPKSN